MPQESLDFQRVIEALNRAGVDFVLIGGLAMSTHGSAHITEDFDASIAHGPATAQALVDALAPYHPRPRGLPEELPFVWDRAFVLNMSTLTLESDLGNVDFLTEPAGAPRFEALRERAVKKALFGYEVRIACVDDLIAMKKAAGRVKDQLHLLELEAIKKILAEQPDQLGTVVE